MHYHEHMSLLDLDPGAMAADVRRTLGDSVRSMVSGEGDLEEVFATHQGDPGLFGPDSVTWRVHGDLSMFVGGIRALFLQTVHPLAMAGVAEHSDYRVDPLGRLHRTAAFVGTTTYAATPVAEQAIAVVRAVHNHVRGTAPDGRPYSANDPDLLTWVHATEVDSFLRAYQRYGSEPLSDTDADRYLDEVAVTAIGLGAEWVPRSRAEMREYFRRVRPELHAGRQARDTARWLCFPPLPLAGRAPYAVLCGAAIGMLPGRVRRSLWLPAPPGADAVVVAPATRALLSGLGWVLGAESPVLEMARARVLWDTSV